MAEVVSPLNRLTRWYLSQCDGDWEHSYGISIETLDNPGWHMRIELTDTGLAGVPFEAVQRGVAQEYSSGPDLSRWLTCKVAEDVFIGVGGLGDLEEIIRVFVDWAESVEAA